MYAVIETGGKQYQVEAGSQVEVERLAGSVGSRVEFDRVLMVRSDDKFAIGRPWVEQAKVFGEILEQGRGEKIKVFKKKRRKNYRKTRGHRQDFTRVKILEIQGS